MRKGAAGSSSMRNASRITPGIASGATLPELKAPALPYEHPRPGSSLSISATLAPRRRRCQAVQTPTMPAPTTTTASLPFLLISLPCISACVSEWRRASTRSNTRFSSCAARSDDPVSGLGRNRTSPSVRGQSGLFDHFRPLGDLTFQSFGKLLRRVADWIGPFTGHAFAGLRRSEHAHDFAVDLGDDILGRAGRREGRLP